MYYLRRYREMVSLAERALEGELGAGIMESVRGYGGRCATRHDADVGGMVSYYSFAAGVDLMCSLESRAVTS